jgi:hypothetical protein
MENGVDTASDDLVKTVQRQLKGGQGELERAKVAPKGTEFSGEIDGIEFDQIRPNGDLYQVKKMRAVRRGARSYNETVDQIKRTLEVAQRHAINGKPRQVTIEFPEGLSKDVGDDFRAITVNGQKAIIVADEVIVPPK